MKRRITGIVILSALLAGFSMAEVVCQDDFSGSGSSALNGAAPDVGSGTWTGPTDDIMADGTCSGTDSKTAYLPVTMEAGRVYTLTAELNIGANDSGNASWAAICLAPDEGSVDTYPAQGSYYLSYLLLRKNGGARAYCRGVSAFDTSTGLYSGTVELTIVVDTTGETWSYDYRVNGSSVHFAGGGAASPGTMYLRIGHYAGMGAYSIESFSLQVEGVDREGDIIADDFSGAGTSALNGIAPDTSLGFATWTGPTNDIMANGTCSAASHGFAYFPFTMETGKVYTLTMGLDMLGSLESENICFTTIALATDAGNIYSYPPSGGYFSYLLLRRNGAVRAYCSGVSAYDTDPGLYSGTVELTIVADTTGETWSYDYLVNGSSVHSATGAAARAGPVYLRVGHYAGFGAYSIENLTVSLPVSSTPFQLWIGDYPGVGTATDMLDDPDGDGRNNLTEWALGGNPGDAGDAGNSPVVQFAEADGTNWLEYVYAKRNDAESLGLTYQLEQNTSLLASTSWTNGNVEVVGTGELDSEFDAVTNRISTEAESRQFLRLRVESN